MEGCIYVGADKGPPMNELMPAPPRHKRVTSKAPALPSQHYRSIIKAMGHIGERDEAPRLSASLQQTTMRTPSFPVQEDRDG